MAKNATPATAPSSTKRKAGDILPSSSQVTTSAEATPTEKTAKKARVSTGKPATPIIIPSNSPHPHAALVIDAPSSDSSIDIVNDVFTNAGVAASQHAPKPKNPFNAISFYNDADPNAYWDIGLMSDSKASEDKWTDGESLDESYHPVYLVPNDPYPDDWSGQLRQKLTETWLLNHPHSILAAFCGKRGNSEKLTAILAAIKRTANLKVKVSSTYHLKADGPWYLVDARDPTSAQLLIDVAICANPGIGHCVVFRPLGCSPSDRRHFVARVHKNSPIPSTTTLKAAVVQHLSTLPELVQIANTRGTDYYIKAIWTLDKPNPPITYISPDRQLILTFRIAEDCKICHSHEHPTKTCQWAMYGGVKRTWALELGEEVSVIATPRAVLTNVDWF